MMTGRHADMPISRHTGKRPVKNIHIGIQTNRKKETCRVTDTDRQIKMEIDRHTDRQEERRIMLRQKERQKMGGGGRER
jgi:hypothetical protein